MATASSTLSPIQSSTNFTLQPIISIILGTICFRENSSCFPFGLPKWLIKTQLPPSSKTLIMVGFAASILVASVTSNLSFKGTLKSTRIMAFLFLKLKSFNVFMWVVFLTKILFYFSLKKSKIEKLS